MIENKVWQIEVHIDEHDGGIRAVARLHNGDQTRLGEGRTRLAQPSRTRMCRRSATSWRWPARCLTLVTRCLSPPAPECSLTFVASAFSTAGTKVKPNTLGAHTCDTAGRRQQRLRCSWCPLHRTSGTGARCAPARRRLNGDAPSHGGE